MNQVSKKPLARKDPWQLVAIRVALRGLSTIAPNLAATTAFKLWFYPRRHAEPAREKAWLASAEQFEVPHDPGSLAAYRWGQGPKVLLVHGWDGRGAQLGAFVEPLSMAGFQVVAFDLPAHGRSSGKKTNMLEAANSIRAMASSLGNIEAVIAHSFGAGALARALASGLSPNKAVMIAPPATLRWMADNFFDRLQLNRDIRKRIESRLARDYGESVWQDVSPENNVLELKVAGLIVHDEGDGDVPFAHGQRLANVWPGAQLQQTRGLGHRRILRDKNVINSIVEFLKG
jgi:pimeloyl-ACP methyl ester carboxylesterase